MSVNRTRRLAASWLLALATLGMVAALARRAAAATPPPAPGELAGSGSLQGTEVVNDATWSPTQGALCQEETKSIYGLRGVGTYEGRTASGQTIVYKASID